MVESSVTFKPAVLERRANELLGVPYAHRGRDAAAGLDCWGVVAELYRACGVEVPDLVAIEQDRTDDPEVLEYWLGAYAHLFAEVPRTELLPGDLLALQGIRDHWSHAAVVLDRTWSLHTTRTTGVIRQRTSTLVLLPQLHSVRRWVG